MTSNVHYLVRHPNSMGQLLYPIEVDEDYQSFGTFFLLGKNIDDVKDSYIFAALLKGELIYPNLQRYRSTNRYISDIIGVGSFEFRATNIGIGALYSGIYKSEEGEYAARQLEIRSHASLDRAVLEHDFFFVGYTPQL